MSRGDDPYIRDKPISMEISWIKFCILHIWKNEIIPIPSGQSGKAKNRTKSALFTRPMSEFYSHAILRFLSIRERHLYLHTIGIT